MNTDEVVFSSHQPAHPEEIWAFGLAFFNSRTETQISVSEFSPGLVLKLPSKTARKGRKMENMFMWKWLKVIFYMYLLTCPRNLPKERCTRLSLNLVLCITHWQFNLEHNWGPLGAYCQMCIGVFRASTWFYCFRKRRCIKAECCDLNCGTFETQDVQDLSRFV